ncbi:MAG: 5-formyltetrahydrofolate cyclo-ligase [Candidatus Peribacteraceae bacterium]|jgi:5-formyltetrahydrofolate cyclo-ligase
MRSFEEDADDSEDADEPVPSLSVTTPEQKLALRQNISKELSRLDARRKADESSAVCEHILQSLPPDTASLCAYLPLTDEVDLRPALEELLRSGIPLFLPLFDFDAGILTFHRVASLDEVRKGRNGLPEPPRDAPQADPSHITLVLAPGRAFDRSGGRLGRGKGGYDRWIAGQRKTNPSTRFLGIAFREQMVDRVPMDEHDERMDGVVTPEGRISTSPS